MLRVLGSKWSRKVPSPMLAHDTSRSHCEYHSERGMQGRFTPGLHH